MRNSHPKTTELLLNNSESLLNIQKHASLLIKLDLVVNSLLPEPLRFWCRVANLRGQHTLVLETASAVWLLQLRHYQLQLLNTLKTDILPSLSIIDIKINPHLLIKPRTLKHSSLSKKGTDTPKDKHLIKPYLSISSANALNTVISKSSGSLRKILEKLTAHKKEEQ